MRRGRRFFSKGPVRLRENCFREEEFEMPTGTIKKLVSDRGFGFIAAEDGREYFFHRTGLDSSVNFDSLAGGERVNFEIEASQKGPRANRIKLA
jgi:cold shock protein